MFCFSTPAYSSSTTKCGSRASYSCHVRSEDNVPERECHNSIATFSGFFELFFFWGGGVEGLVQQIYLSGGKNKSLVHKS